LGEISLAILKKKENTHCSQVCKNLPKKKNKNVDAGVPLFYLFIIYYFIFLGGSNLKEYFFNKLIKRI